MTRHLFRLVAAGFIIAVTAWVFAPLYAAACTGPEDEVRFPTICTTTTTEATTSSTASTSTTTPAPSTSPTTAALEASSTVATTDASSTTSATSSPESTLVTDTIPEGSCADCPTPEVSPNPPSFTPSSVLSPGTPSAPATSPQATIASSNTLPATGPSPYGGTLVAIGAVAIGLGAVALVARRRA